MAGVEVLAELLFAQRDLGIMAEEDAKADEPRTGIPVSLESGTARLLHHVSEKGPDLGLLANGFEFMIVV